MDSGYHRLRRMVMTMNGLGRMAFELVEFLHMLRLALGISHLLSLGGSYFIF
jgi:hypothetical protein